MEEWRNGGMEEWKTWKNGWVEEWMDAKKRKRKP